MQTEFMRFDSNRKQNMHFNGLRNNMYVYLYFMYI